MNIVASGNCPHWRTGDWDHGSNAAVDRVNAGNFVRALVGSVNLGPVRQFRQGYGLRVRIGQRQRVTRKCWIDGDALHNYV